jgi:hypothetical protein
MVRFQPLDVDMRAARSLVAAALRDQPSGTWLETDVTADLFAAYGIPLRVVRQCSARFARERGRRDPRFFVRGLAFAVVPWPTSGEGEQAGVVDLAGSPRHPQGRDAVAIEPNARSLP